MGKYFGTDGFRGEVNRILTVEHAFAIGKFLGAAARERGAGARIVIGRDTRRSADALESALVAGMTACGSDAVLLGVVPTPAVSHLIAPMRACFGIMISASHNPYGDNGIKVFTAEGEKADETFSASLEGYLDHVVPLPLAVGDALGIVLDGSEARHTYVEHRIRLVDAPLNGMHIALDCANGSAFAIARTVFERLGAQVSCIHDAPNGININENCGSTHIESLQRLVVARQADCGFAFDGDADRCIAVDETGQVVDGDGILWVMGQALAKERRLTGQTVVTTVMSNLGLRQAFEKLGIRCEATAVGDRFVQECIRRGGYALGGEPSGHIIFGDIATTGDGLITALKVAEQMAKSGRSLRELAQGYSPYPQCLHSLPVADRAAAMADGGVQRVLGEIRTQLGTKGRVLLRPSGTEPVLRVMVEASDAALCEACAERICTVLREGGFLP